MNSLYSKGLILGLTAFLSYGFGGESDIPSTKKLEGLVKKDVVSSEIKKLPKISLSPQQATKYSPRNFSLSATSNFSLSKSATASCEVLNPDLEIKESVFSLLPDYQYNRFIEKFSKQDTLPDLATLGWRIELETGDDCSYGNTSLGIRLGIGNYSSIDSPAFNVQINDTTPVRIIEGLKGDKYTTIWVPGYVAFDANIAVVDSDNEIQESDETNNILVGLLPIPTFPPTCTPLPTITLTPTPTYSVTPTLTDTPIYNADINRDGKVNVDDLLILLEQWNEIKE